MTQVHKHLHKHLAFRCDGNTYIGLGHVVGSLRLAKLAAREFNCESTFFMRDNLVAVSLVLEAGFSVEILPVEIEPDSDIARLIDFAISASISGIVINFCKDDLERYSHLFSEIKSSNLGLIFMDNPIPPGCWAADLIINALPHPDYPGYTPKRHAACLDGLEYFLLNDDHVSLRRTPRQVRSKIERALVAMGGGDALNVTTRVVDALALAKFDGYVDVVLGAANPHEREVRGHLTQAGLKGDVNRNCNDLPQRIIAADVGFSALGLTTYEMAALGLPVLIISGTSLNTKAADQYASQYEAAEHLGPSKVLSVEDIASSFDRLRGDHALMTTLSDNGNQVGSQMSDVVSAIIKALSVEKMARRIK